MDNFAKQIDLSRFFSDERKCSLVCVDPKWTSVEDLQKHVQKLFNLTCISLLTNDGFFLPPQESIVVIKYVQSLRAFTLDIKGNECHSSNENPSKKRKKNSTSSPSKAKRSKTPTNLRLEISNHIPAVLETSYDNIEGRHSPNKNCIADSQNKTISQIETPIQSETKCHEDKLKKIDFCCELMELDFQKPRVFQIKKKFKNTNIQILENIVLKCPNSVCKPIEEGLKSSTQNVESNENPAPVIEQIVTDNSIHNDSLPEESKNTTVDGGNLDIESDDSVMVLDDDLELDVIESRDDTHEVLEDMLQNSAPLSNLPNVGETVIFKLLKIQDSPNEGVTDYLAGSCTYVNRRSKLISLSIIVCPDHFRKFLNRFCTHLDKTNEPGNLKINLKMQDMIDAKIVVSAVD